MVFNIQIFKVKYRTFSTIEYRQIHKLPGPRFIKLTCVWKQE